MQIIGHYKKSNFREGNKNKAPGRQLHPCSSVSIVNFEHAIAGWALCHKLFLYSFQCLG